MFKIDSLSLLELCICLEFWILLIGVYLEIDAWVLVLVNYIQRSLKPKDFRDDNIKKALS